jgi:hypothetical protein
MYIFVILLLLIITAYSVMQIITKIIQQQKCLDDNDLRMVVSTEIRYQDNYDAAIAHLGICRKCEKRLEEISRE